MLPKKFSKDTSIKMSPYRIIEIVKMTIYSDDFQNYVKKYMQKTGKNELSSSEILDLYSNFLKS